MAGEERNFERLKDEGYTLVLSSGGARGMAHIGVMIYMEQHQVPIKAIVGCSIGAELGAFWAAGISAEVFKETVLSLNWTDSFKIFMPDRIQGGFCSGAGVRRFLKKFLGEQKIEDWKTPFAAATTDYHTGELVMIEKGDAVQAVRASVGIPGILTPTIIGGKTLIDGAVASPLPLEWAYKKFGGPIIAVSVQDSTADGKMPGPLGVVRHSNCLMQTRLMRKELAAYPPEYLIEPDIRGSSILKFHAAKHLMLEGYLAAKKVLRFEEISEEMHKHA